MAVLLEIVIFKVYKEDTGDKISEFIYAHATIGSRHKKVRAETYLSIAHMAIRGVDVRWAYAELIARFEEEGHLPPEVSDAEGGWSHLSVPDLAPLGNSRDGSKGWSNSYIDSKYVD